MKTIIILYTLTLWRYPVWKPESKETKLSTLYCKIRYYYQYDKQATIQIQINTPLFVNETHLSSHI